MATATTAAAEQLSFHLHDIVNSFNVTNHLIMTQTCVKYDYVAWRFRSFVRFILIFFSRWFFLWAQGNFTWTYTLCFERPYTKFHKWPKIALYLCNDESLRYWSYLYDDYIQLFLCFAVPFLVDVRTHILNCGSFFWHRLLHIFIFHMHMPNFTNCGHHSKKQQTQTAIYLQPRPCVCVVALAHSHSSSMHMHMHMHTQLQFKNRSRR